MARRGQRHEEELPFVALMDTMTNVVGVLIIVLVMIGIGLAKSVSKVLSELPPVSVEEHAKLQQQVAASTTKETPEAVQEQLAQLQQMLLKSDEDLKNLETTRQKQNIKVVDTTQLEQQLAERKKEREARKTAIDKLLAEVETLKARLDTTPVYQPPPATVVKLPNSRAIPERAVMQRFLVSGGQIYYLDFEGAEKLATADFISARQSFERDRIKVPQKPDRIIYDQEKVARHSEMRRLALRNLDVRLTPNKFGTRMNLQLNARPGQGEPIANALKMTSVFREYLRRFKTGNNVVWLHVARDSYDSYSIIREAIDSMGLPVGWEVAWTPSVGQGAAWFEVARMAEPPPVDPNAIQIAPPKQTVD